jgi:hypothetical protein
MNLYLLPSYRRIIYEISEAFFKEVSGAILDVSWALGTLRSVTPAIDCGWRSLDVMMEWLAVLMSSSGLSVPQAGVPT